MQTFYLRRIRFSVRILSGLIRYPNLFVIAFTQYFAGIFVVHGLSVTYDIVVFYKFSLLVLATTLVAAGGYIINDYYDIKIDLVNKPEKVVVGRFLNRRMAMLAHLVFSISGILLAFLVSWKIAVIVFTSSFLLWIYSIYLKRKPFVGNLTIAILCGLSVMLPAVYFQKGYLAAGFFSALAFFMTLIREIIKDMEDMKGDASFGCRTLPIVLGIRKTKNIIYLILFLFLSTLLLFSSNISTSFTLSVTLLVGVPVVYFIAKLIRADTVKEFGNLSFLCKIIMISGIVTMILI